MINVGNITQYETLWSMKPCFLPKWLLVYVPKDVRRNCKSWEAVDPQGGRDGRVMLQQKETIEEGDNGQRSLQEHATGKLEAEDTGRLENAMLRQTFQRSR